MKKNKISKNWIRDHYKDQFVKKSKIQGYRSRSAFKLIEINKKFNLIKKSSYPLDLGSSPGGWSQVASEKINSGKILAVDIKSMEKINNVSFIMGDFYEKQTQQKITTYFAKKIDVVISDMAANTTGIKTLDSDKTGELCLNAMDLATKILTQNGSFLSKIFMGSIYREINDKAKKCFKNVIRYKPLSSKKTSKEIYIYCKGVLKI